MAGELDAVRAGAAGPRLGARRPLAVFGWGVLTVLVYGLALALMGSMVGDMSEAPESLESGDFVAQMLRHQMLTGPLNLLIYAHQAVIGAAVMRAVLRPAARDPFLFLRVGVTELLLLVVQIAIGFGLMVVMVILALLVGGVGFGLAMVSQTVGLTVGVLGGLAAVVVMIWLLLRTALIPPLTVATRRLAFVEGWALAGGRMIPLFGVAVLALVLLFALHLVFMATLVAGSAAAGLWGGLSAETPLPFPFDPAVDWAALAPWLVPIGLGLSVFAGLAYAFMLAPWAEACRQLAGDGADGRPEGGAAA